MPEPYDIVTIPTDLIHAIEGLPLRESQTIFVRLGFMRKKLPTYRNVAQLLKCSDLDARRLEVTALRLLKEKVPEEQFERLRNTLGKWLPEPASPSPAA